jgi:hypothetical protein
MLGQVRGDLGGWWMLSLSQIAPADGVGQGEDLATGRSGDFSCPAPLIRHGLRRMSP